MNAVDAGKAFVEERFPACLAAFVGGSVLRGEGTATSDLDIVVVVAGDGAPYRESVRAFGWPIEVFVHTPESIRQFFHSDAERRRPSLPRMVAEGAVVRDRDGLAGQIRQEARALLERGPAPLTANEIETRRYAITDLLDDFLGCERFDEGMFIADDLAVEAADLLLAGQGCWTGSGKWVLRALRELDPALAERLAGALASYYRRENKDDLVRFVDDVLAPFGGRLFEGYHRSGKPP